jgi:hypothetical protein
MTTWTTASRIAAAGVELDGDLTMPEHAAGLVLFAHGSGSSRQSPRNLAVAETLNQRDLATLLVDLLTTDEEQADARTRELRFVLARKIGAPGRPEFGVGAIAEDGPPVFDWTVLQYLQLTQDDLADTVAAERAELNRRSDRHRRRRLAPQVTDRIAPPSPWQRGASDQSVLRSRVRDGVVQVCQP